MEDGGRKLLGNNSGAGVGGCGILQPITVQCDGIWISAGLTCA